MKIYFLNLLKGKIIKAINKINNGFPVAFLSKYVLKTFVLFSNTFSVVFLLVTVLFPSYFGTVTFTTSVVFVEFETVVLLYPASTVLDKLPIAFTLNTTLKLAESPTLRKSKLKVCLPSFRE